MDRFPTHCGSSRRGDRTLLQRQDQRVTLLVYSPVLGRPRDVGGSACWAIHLVRRTICPTIAPLEEKSTWRHRQVLDFPTQFGRRDWTRTNDPHHVKVGKRDDPGPPGT